MVTALSPRDRTAVIVDAVRSPIGRGKATGALAGLHPVELLAQVLDALVIRSGVQPGLVDDVLVGCVTQSGEQSATPGRQAVLAAGWPVSVPSVSIERKCGSGQQAVEFAAAGVVAGLYDIAIAAGVESMSRVPMGSNRGHSDPVGDVVRARFPDLVAQGVSAELVAAHYGISREEMDAYALQSCRRADEALRAGLLAQEIVPIIVDDQFLVDTDETIRTGTSLEALAGLKPAFRSDEMSERFRQVDWGVTAGNSSQISDGAAAMLIMEEATARRMGLRPRARIVASAVCGDDPTLMLTGPIPATRKVLDRCGLSIDDIDAFEVNEAFASVVLAWQREFAVPDERVNPRGGAIALGHPLGASGIRLMTTLINHLETSGGRFGLQVMCEAGGMANATVIEIERPHPPADREQTQTGMNR